jgi:hypothetical protein
MKRFHTDHMYLTLITTGEKQVVATGADIKSERYDFRKWTKCEVPNILSYEISVVYMK